MIRRRPLPRRRRAVSRARLRCSARTPGRHAAGQAIVEFSLSLLAFLTFVFAVISGSVLMFTYLAVDNGAQNGARTAILVTSTHSGAVGADGTVGQPLTSTIGLATVLTATVAGVGPVPIDRTPLVAKANGSYANSNIVITGTPNLCTPTTITVTIAYTHTVVPGRLVGVGKVPMNAQSVLAVPNPAQAGSCLPPS